MMFYCHASCFFPKFYVVTVINLLLLLGFVVFRKLSLFPIYKGIHIFSPLCLFYFVIYIKIFDLFKNYSDNVVEGTDLIVLFFLMVIQLPKHHLLKIDHVLSGYYYSVSTWQIVDSQKMFDHS